MEKVLEEGEMTEGQWAFAHDLNELVNTILLEARYFIIVRLGVCVCVCVSVLHVPISSHTHTKTYAR